MSSSGVSSTARKREGWNFKCALTFRYNQAPPAIAYIHCYKIVLMFYNTYIYKFAYNSLIINTLYT
jgi:hypothetical protein